MVHAQLLPELLILRLELFEGLGIVLAHGS